MTDAAAPPARMAPKLGLLTVTSLVLLVAMDGSVLYLAIPRIAAALSPSPDQMLWILDIYGFVVGSLLVAFGAIGDRYGRVRLIMAGAALFGLGSVGAAFAGSADMLIACRALMGVGGATLLPSGLALVSVLFPDPRARAQAIGIFAATFAAGFALGPLMGGVILGSFDWGAVFLLNVPVVIAFLIAAPHLLRDVRPAAPGRIDLPSLALSFVGLLLVSAAVKKAAAYGLAPGTMAMGAAGFMALAAFLRRQGRIDDPLLDIGLFKDRVFALAILTGLLSLVVWSATGYLTGIYLQTVLGYAVLPAAMLTLPGALVLTATCILTSRIVDRIGRKAALVATHLLIGAGVFALLFTRTDGGASVVVLSSLIASIGYGLSFSLVADIAISAVPPDRAGAAGSIAETSNEIGNALGISLLGSLAAACFRLYGPGLTGSLGETLALTDVTAEAVAQAKQAFLTGLHAAASVGATLALLAGLLAWRWLPRRLPDGSAGTVR